VMRVFDHGTFVNFNMRFGILYYILATKK